MTTTIELPSGQQVEVSYYYNNYPDIQTVYINGVPTGMKVLARIEGMHVNDLVRYIEETIEETIEEAEADASWNRADDRYDLLRDN